MKRGLSSSVLGVTTALLLLTGSSAGADEPGFAVDPLGPAERGSDWFANASLDLRGHLRPAVGVTYSWTYRPYLLYAEDGTEQARVLTDQMVLHPGGALVLLHRLRLALDVPVVVFQHGDDLGFVTGPKPSPSTPAFGDVRLGTDLRLFGEFGGIATAAIGMQTFLPTGSQEQLTSDGTVRLLPRAMLAGHFMGVVYALHGGFHFRPLGDEVMGRALGSEVTFAAAAGVKVNDVFILGPELAGRTMVTKGDPFAARTTPIELLLGFHVVLGDHWRAGSAIGSGFGRAEGSPLMRLVASFEYAEDYCVDKDGDGICAYRDACPELAGVPSFTRLTNGCPRDKDRDGFIDDEDKCPHQPGVKTGDPQTTGCPDRDKDGVPDKLDACPAVAGITAGDSKTRGCPKPKPAAKVEGPEVQTSEPIRFVDVTAEIHPESEPMLEAVTKLLTEKPDLHVAIIAQVVAVGAPPELAERRALSVKFWLEAHGIARERLTVQTPSPQDPAPQEDRIQLRVIEQKEPVGPPLD